MKPMFVDVHRGEKRIHWLRFFVFAIAVIVLAAVIGLLFDFLVIGRYGYTAPLVGATVALLILARVLIRMIGYQPLEVESDMQSS